MERALLETDWATELNPNDINAAVETFSHIVRTMIERYVPRARVRPPGCLPWQTPALLRLKTAKKAAFKRSKVSLATGNHYRRVNNAYKNLSRRCYSSYRRQMESKLKTEPSKFWKFINDQRKESGLPSSMNLNGEVAHDTASICGLFAAKFASVFSNETLTTDQIQEAANNVPVLNHTISSINIDEAVVRSATSRLKNSTSPGPDGIPAILLKKCTSGLLAPLVLLFRLSLSSGTFPTAWKMAYLFPVFKKGDRTMIDNYRGISALCAISKLLELVVMGPFVAHCRTFLANAQHGFIPKRSTATNLLSLTSYVMDSFNNRSQTDVVYTDLSAAFDKINHQIAVAKLDRVGFFGPLLKWFESYLVGRTLRVKIGDAVSDSFPATSGIGQGGHLGPAVFLVYFNDAPNQLDCPYLVFADDLKIFRRIDSLSDAANLQLQLETFGNWCFLNRMVVNPSKCSVISFSRKLRPIAFVYSLNGTPIPRTDHIKDLGVILDSKLTFKQHVSFIISKASRQLGFIMRMTRDFKDIKCLTALYCSLVRSSLEYCSTVWSPYYNNAVSRIESIQRRFVRYALRLLPWRHPMRDTPYENRCLLLHLDTLQLRRETARAMVISDLLTANVDCADILQRININAPSRALRGVPALRIPLRRTNYSLNSAIVGLQRAFNRVASMFDFNLHRIVIRNKFVSMFRQIFYH